ncbi:MAG: molybdopterin-dependent oxidoreductase [Syntrophaceae bacterium]|nr:molybdopterin-dependent oxidoreductase [Syntrophaceae bacterium]
MNRREFLKLCLGAPPALLFNSFFELHAYAEATGGKQISRHTKKPLKGIPSLCQLCPARCGIIGFLEGDQLVKIGGNPKHPNNLGKLCSRGLAGVNMAYDPDRLSSPMMRRGERGKGHWERISWERAYSEMVSRLKTIYQGGTKGDFVFHSEHEPYGIPRLFLDAFGKAMILHDDQLHFSNRNLAQWLTWGEERGVPDVANSHYILNFGSNFYETHEDYTGLIGRVIEGRLTKKAKLVTFDVRLSYTAGNSNEWFPITPGTDGMVALAMANVIIQDNLYDKNFIQRWFNIPFSQLVQYLSNYTPEAAEKVSGISAADIERIAKEFAISMPAIAISGPGVSGHFNGVYNERCIFLLNAILGNIDIRGGYCLPRTYRLSRGDTTALDLDKAPLNPQKFISLVKRRKLTPKIYFINESNPAYSNPESGLTSEVLKDEKLIPYLVVADSYMTETAMLADMVLPVASYLERGGIDSSPSLDLIPFVALQQPILRPYAKSVPIDDICIELSQRIGSGIRRSFRFNSTEEYIKKVISSIPKLEKVGGWPYLKEHGVWFDKDEKPRMRGYESRGFKTPSGKIEIYSERLRKKGFQPLPIYEPIPGHGDLKGKFVLVTYEPNVMGPKTANFKWLAEIKHHNFIWINRDVAKILHIEEGDRVKITAKTGTFVREVRFTFGIHPRVVAIERNLGHWGYGHIAQAKRIKSKDPNTYLVWWEKEGNGVSPNQVIPGESDPIGGGEAWNDTIVTISKI